MSRASFLLTVAALCVAAALATQNRPIIGILSQPLSSETGDSSTRFVIFCALHLCLLLKPVRQRTVTAHERLGTR